LFKKINIHKGDLLGVRGTPGWNLVDR